jgi:hypothetical protein
MSLREGWGDLDFWQMCIPSGAGRVVQPPGSVHRVTEFSQGLATEWHVYPRGELKIRRPIVRAEVDRLRDPELPDRLADTETAAQDATDDAWQEAVGDLVAELVDLQERMDALVGRYRRLGGLLNHHLQADVAEAVDAHQGTARLLNANVAAEIGEVLARYRQQADALNVPAVRGGRRARCPLPTPCSTGSPSGSDAS